ncbi:MAG: hypothetical protein U1F00_08195 [Rhodoferax sp.]
MRGDNLGKLVIGIRGTAQRSPLTGTNDIQALDDIASHGAALGQIVALHNWWLRASTRPSDAPNGVLQYAYEPLGLGVILAPNRPATGELVDALAGSPGGKVWVTGSSLGGHLAMAFAGLFPGVVEQAVAVNAPGIEPSAVVQNAFAMLGGTVPAAGNPQITNVISTEVNSGAGQLDVIAGFPGGNFPGQLVTVPIENQWQTDVADPKVPSWNHDQRQVTDALAVFDMLQRLDPAWTLAQFGALLRAAASGENRSLENIVDTARSWMGIPHTPLPAGNAQRDALHLALRDIAGSATSPASAAYAAMAGQLRLQPASAGLGDSARTDFGAWLALRDLMPFTLAPAVGASAAASAAWGEHLRQWRPTEYAQWMADQAAGETPRLTSEAWLADRSMLLGALMQRNAGNNTTGLQADPQAPPDRLLVFRFTDPELGLAPDTLLLRNPAGGAVSPLPHQTLAFGDARANLLQGTDSPLADHLYGEAGDDTLAGLAGDDWLEGGQGDDLYVFDGLWGLDQISDADGQGRIQLDGQLLTGGGASGTARLWLGVDEAGQTVRYMLRDSQASATGQQLLIARAGQPTHTVTINHFDLAAATSGAGYLGLHLDNRQDLLLVQGGGASTGSPFATPGFDPRASTGQSTLAEGGAAVFTVFLRAAAQLGDQIQLVLSGLQDRFDTLVGRTRFSAHGAVIPLEAGQTQVSFVLEQQGAVAADTQIVLTARVGGPGGPIASNDWTLQVQDTGLAGLALSGDQAYRQGTSAVAIYRDGLQVVAPGGPRYPVDAQGNLLPDAGGIVLLDNVLYGADGPDQLQGLLGQDALDGGAGNDVLEGGDGDDLIAGGDGANQLQGGAGNDFLLGSGTLSRLLQPLGPDDLWVPPPGHAVLARGATWGVHADSADLRIWSGATASGLDVRIGSEIDGGDGDDEVIAGGGADQVREVPGTTASTAWGATT